MLIKTEAKNKINMVFFIENILFWLKAIFDK